jgi:hypothetical protein
VVGADACAMMVAAGRLVPGASDWTRIDFGEFRKAIVPLGVVLLFLSCRVAWRAALVVVHDCLTFPRCRPAA